MLYEIARKALKIVFSIVLVTAVILGAYSVLTYFMIGEYTLHTDEFDSVAVHNGNIEIDGLSISDNRLFGLHKIELTEDMIVRRDDTSSAGIKEIVFEYAGREFVVYYEVKYRVDFVSNGEIIDTQLVFSSDELTPPTPTPNTGYEFSGWDLDLSLALVGNTVVNATYKEVEYPEIGELTATYGDTLADVELPKGSLGYWTFTDPLDTPVGNAGKNKFDVHFVFYSDGTVKKQTAVDLKVEKKTVEFTDVRDVFVYDGAPHFPSCVTSYDVVLLPTGVEMTDAGEYIYGWEVLDGNYQGTYTGVYKITKPTVTVSVSSAVITYGDSVPEFEYTISGFASPDLLGIQITAPEYASQAGVFEIGATCQNPNVNLVVSKGTLTVNKADKDVSNPVVSVAVFGDKLSDVSFNNESFLGEWRWENPDIVVDDMGGITAWAIFTHSNENFNPVRREITVGSVIKRQLSFTVSGSVFTYAPGVYHAVEFTLGDSVYTDVEVLNVIGNTAEINAGRYTKTIVIDDPRYEGSVTVELVINKAVPATDFSSVIDIQWHDGMTLSDIDLPEGYTWDDPTVRLHNAVGGSYPVTFTHSDTANYVSVSGEMYVALSRDDGKINGVLTSYVTTYNSKAYTLTGISANHSDSTLVFEYYLGGEKVSAIIDAGVYTVRITLPETENYKGATAETTVTVNKAENTDIVTQNQTATYGDSLASLILPDSAIGEWHWLENVDTVGNAGVNVFTAVFVPSTDNYLGRTVAVSVTVNKKSVTTPTPENKGYNGAHQASGLTGTALYEITEDLGGVNVGKYPIVLTLLDSDNYTWQNTDNASTTVYFNILSVDNAWTTAPSIGDWTYSSEASAPTADLTYGSYTVEYKLKDALESEYTLTVPTVAGDYVARFTSTNQNCPIISTTVEFTIHKIEVERPTVGSLSATYTGLDIEFAISSSDDYTVSGNVAKNVGSYTATVTLKDSANYRWEDGDSAPLKYTYSITKASNAITDLTMEGWTYNGTSLKNTPTANSSFGEVYFKYFVKNSDVYTEISEVKNAGNYYVKAYVDGTANYDSAESDYLAFTVAKADGKITVPGTAYEFVYCGTDYVITGIGRNHSESSLVYTVNGAVVESIRVVNAGSYVAVVTLPEGVNYNEASETIRIVITPADNTEELPVYDATYLDKLSSLTPPTSEIGSWVWEDAELEVGEVGERSFKMIFTPATGNYNAREAYVTVRVSARKVAKPTLSDTALTYTGSVAQPGINHTEQTLYTVTMPDSVTVGGYSVSVSLKDKSNYVWESNNNAEDLSLTYEITVGQATVSKPDIDGWIFNQTASAPSASVNYDGADVSFVYSTSYSGEYSSQVPTAAGTYYVKAVVSGTGNYNGATSEPTEFVIEKAASVISGLNSSYVLTYSGVAQSITGIDLNHGEGTLVYKLDGETVTSISVTNAGSYTVTVSVAESANYKSASASATVTVNAAENTESVLTTQMATYLDKLSTLTLPAGVEGEWSWLEGDVTVGNAGSNTFTAVFTPDNNNYLERTVTVTVNVLVRNVDIPTISPKKYTGIRITSGLADTAYYTVTEDLGGIDVGTYSVTLTLISYGNSVWVGSTGASVTIEYTIIEDGFNEWEVTPEIDDVTYGENLTVLGSAKHGDVLVEYKASGADDSTYTTTRPTVSGTYVARFTSTSHNYYVISTTVEFTIHKIEVERPTVGSLSATYTGLDIEFAISSSDDYTVSGNVAKNVGSYTATVTLKDSANYRWEDGDSAPLKYTYSITKASNAITDLTMEGWTYNGTSLKNTPTANSSFGEVYFKYFVKNSDVYTEISEVKNAGNYYVKAYVDGTANYDSAESDYLAFTVAKADGKITVPGTAYEFVYCGTDYVITGIGRNHSESSLVYTVNGAVVESIRVVNAGSYVAVVTLPEGVNYNEASETIRIVITPADNTEELPVYDATYLDKLSSLTPPTSEIGSWVWEDAELEVGEVGERSFKMIFTPATGNYNAREAYVTVRVSARKVAKPTLSDTALTYTGSVAQPGINHTEQTLYTVTMPDSVTVGGYSVSVSLKDKSNYVWESNNNAEDLSLTYEITVGQATVSKPDIDGWIFNQTASAPSASVNYDGADVSFVYSTSYSGEYSSQVPTAAGTYYVKAVVSGTGNYNGATSEPTEFVIEKAASVISGLNSSYVLTYSGVAQSITGIDLNHGEGTLVYKLDGETVTSISVTNAGSYTVTVSVAESANYKSASASATVTVNAAENTESVLTTQTATYLDKLSTLTLPEGIEGEWSWLEGDVTVGNAGSNTFTAVFTPDNNNYLERTVTVTVNVAKKAVSLPTVANKVYTSNKIVSGLSDTTLYTVKTDIGGTDVGKYSVTLELTDSSNYKWATVDTADVKVYYEITKANNEWVSSPVHPGATFGDVLTYTASAKYDSVKVTYRLKDDTSAAFTSTAPTAAGTYIARFTTTSVNAYACDEIDVIFTIAKRMITIPQPTDNSFVWDEDVNLGITSTDYYTFTDNNNGNAGAQTATVTLKYPASTYWSDGNTGADRTVNYNVEKATITLSGLTATGWTYLDTPITPTVTKDKTFGTVEFRYSKTKSGTYSATVPTNAGTYFVKAVVEEGVNWNYAESVSVSFVIDKATPTITLTISAPHVNGEYYENLLNLSASSVAKYNGTKVSGTFTDTITFNSDDPTNSTYKITFTSSNTNYYGATLEGTVSLKTVATRGVNGIKYGTIENALNAAEDEETVWVIPDVSGNVVIKGVVTIPEGVTLLIPYGTTNDTNGRNMSDSSTLYYKKNVTPDAVANTNPDTYRKTVVVLEAGATLNVKGTLEISGEISGGSGGRKFASQTAGKYAELQLQAGSLVHLQAGSTAKVYGFIAEEETNPGGMLLADNGSNLYQPLVLLDFKGGSILTAIYYDMRSGYEESPFNQYCMINITATLRINYGANMKNYCNLYAEDQHNSTISHMVGVGGFIELTDSVYSYIVSKVDPDTYINDVKIYGGAKTNTMSLTVLGETMSSDQFIFAIPWLYSITLDNNPEQTDTAYFAMTNKIKMMPGSTFIVESGAELNVNWLSIYKNFTDYMGTGKYKPNYPDYLTSPLAGTLIPAARFVIRGSVIATSIGGDVYADAGGARLEVTGAVKVSSYEPTKTNGSLSMLTRVEERQKITSYLKLYYGENTVGYTVTGIVYESDASLGVWTHPPIEIPPTIAFTPPAGSWVTTTDAVIVNGTEVTFYTYDSSVDGIKTIYVFPDAEIVFHLTKNEVLVTDGSNRLEVSAGQVHSADYTVSWYANTADTLAVYWVPALAISGYGSVDTCTITYENLGTENDGDPDTNPYIKIYLEKSATATALFQSCTATAKFTVETSEGKETYSKSVKGWTVAYATAETTLYIYNDETVKIT